LLRNPDAKLGGSTANDDEPRLTIEQAPIATPTYSGEHEQAPIATPTCSGRHAAASTSSLAPIVQDLRSACDLR
jgi:hypothetical protein